VNARLRCFRAIGHLLFGKHSRGGWASAPRIIGTFLHAAGMRWHSCSTSSWMHCDRSAAFSTLGDATSTDGSESSIVTCPAMVPSRWRPLSTAMCPNRNLSNRRAYRGVGHDADCQQRIVQVRQHRLRDLGKHRNHLSSRPQSSSVSGRNTTRSPRRTILCSLNCTSDPLLRRP
jgi:hypothetical protein